MAVQKYKELLSSASARHYIKSGIRKATEAVAPTLGVKGRKIALDSEFGKLEVIDDGYTILRSIELEDPREQIGVKLLRDAATSTNDKIGDGTTTTAIIANKLVAEIVKDDDPLLIKQISGNVLRIRKEIVAATLKVLAFIDKNKIEVSNDGVKNVAYVSSNNEEIGDILALIFNKLGKDGSVLVQESHSLNTFHEFVEGMKIDKGWISPAMITDGEAQQAELHHAKVLVTDHKIRDPQDLEWLVRLFKSGVNDLLIVADEVSGMPLDFLVANKVTGAIRVVAINGPALGNIKDHLTDIAVFTGATLVSKDNNISLKDVTIEMLGTAESVVSTKDSTTIAAGGGSNADVGTRITTIQTQFDKETSKYEQEKLKERIGKLRGGVGIIKVGGATETEVNEKKAKIDDAIHAVRAALEDGVVAGGGVMLVRAAQELDEKIEGEKALKMAIMAPFAQLIENADFDSEKASIILFGNDNVNYGFNIETETYGDMVKFGIVDPALVVKTALNNAVSTALLVQSIAGASALIRKTDDKLERQG
jgi:chaperonin GroEL